MLQEDADIHVITQTKIRNVIHCTARVNTHEIRLKINTGAKCNVLPLDLFKKVQQREMINKAKAVNLVAYGGKGFSTLGTADLQCKIGDTTRLLTFQVLDRQATPILGLNDALQLNLVKLDRAVYEVDADAEDAFRQQVITEYADLFDDQLGNLAARYTMREDKSVTPVVKPARKIPQAMEKKVKEELGNMVKKDVIVRETEPTEWVSQMVYYSHQKEERRRTDMSVLTQRFEQSSHIIPCVLQMMWPPDWGMRRSFQRWMRRLDFGRSSSKNNPLYVQRSVHHMGGTGFSACPLASTQHQKCSSKPWKDSLKDIHAQSLSTTSSSGVLLKKNMMPTSGKPSRELDRLVWSWTSADASSGREASPSWDTRSRMEVWRLTQKRQMQFETCQHQKTKQLFKGFSEWQTTWTSSSRTTVKKTATLRELLHNDVVWNWTETHQQAFDRLKDDLTNPPVLKFFDAGKPVVLSVDASKSGLGAACLQDDAPVAFASRALSDAETRYAQIEKELLAAVFACRKFHDFNYGRRVTIETDHKPLITIVKKPLHAAPARLQRMLLQLQRYDLQFVYKKGKELFLADTLSRAYPDEPPEETNFEYDVMTVLSISADRMTELQRETLADATMQKLAKFIKEGWPGHERSVPPDVKPFFPFRDELVVENDVIMKGPKAVVPKSLQSTYIVILHKGHMGSDRTKQLASDVVYLLAKDATRHRECCFSVFCMQQLQSPSPEATPHQSPRPWPSLGNCWSRHFWLEQPPVPGHGGFLLWLVWGGFTAW